MGVNGLLELLLYLLIGGLIVWLVYWIIGILNLPEVPRRIIVIVVAIIVLVWLLRTLVPGIL